MTFINENMRDCLADAYVGESEDEYARADAHAHVRTYTRTVAHTYY